MLKKIHISLLTAFFLSISCSIAYAQQCTYSGPTAINQSAWDDSSNWDCGHVPIAGEEAKLPQSSTYTIAGDIFTPAIVLARGATTLVAGTTLNCSRLTVDADFINHGTILFNGSPAPNYRIAVRSGDTFTNSSTGVINVTSATHGGIRLAEDAVLNNSGSISINVAANRQGINLLANAAYTDMNSGTLNIISGMTNCTLGTCSFNLLLPVILKEIQAYEKGAANAIEWATVSEENSYYFAVEYMEQNANTWRELERISAAGDSDYLIEYDFQHENPAEKAYYRLKMVDLDGSFEYSTILSVHNQNAAASKFPVRLYPTVSAGTIYLERQNLERPINIVRIFNATGQMVKVNDLSSNRESSIKLSVSDLQAGMYFLRVDNQAAQRFIISK